MPPAADFSASRCVAAAPKAVFPFYFNPVRRHGLCLIRKAIILILKVTPMKIASDISSHYQTAAARQKLAATRTSDAALTSNTASSGASIRVNDFTSMTSNQMKSVAKGLFDTGKIGLTQLFQLENAGIPLGKAGPNGEFIALSPEERESFRNTPMNYMDLIKDAMSGIEAQGKAADLTSGYQSWKDLLSVLQDNQGSVSGVDVRV